MDVKSEAWERAVHEIAPQSEKLDRALVVSTFVDMGHLNRLANQSSHYIQGRRRTGKTHLITYFADSVNDKFSSTRAIAVFIDARTVRVESGDAATPTKHLAKDL